MRRFGYATAVSLAVLAVFAGPTPAAFQAYTGPGTATGNTDWTGSLGNDFNVGATAISVTQLGAFDSFAQQGGGFGTNVISVAIFNRTTGLVVGPIVTFSGTEGTLTNNYRMKDIAPVVLAAGFQGSIVAWSYNSTERAFDGGDVPLPAGWGTNGGGLISFVGTGRTGAAGAYPGTANAAGAPNRYGAGNFSFEQGPTAVPVPPTIVMLGVTAVGGLLVRLRRKAVA
jgi:hypothetical protein